MTSRRVSRAGGLATSVLIACALASLASAGEAGPYERNDTRAKAFGPLKEDKAYRAAIEELDNPETGKLGDTDWYELETKGKSTLSISYSNRQEFEECFGPEARLLNRKNETLGTAQPPAGETEQIKYTSSKPRTLFLRVRPYHLEPCVPPDSRYRFTVDELG